MRRVYARLLDAAKDQRNPSRQLVDAIARVDRSLERQVERRVAKGELPGTRLRRHDDAHPPVSVVHGMGSGKSSQDGASSNGDRLTVVVHRVAKSDLRST
jgi:hypothetical protein